MIADLPKGSSTLLPYTQTGRGRITVGISWDTPEFIPEQAEKFRSEMDEGLDSYGEDLDIEIGYTTEVFDLDLVCLIFNQDKEIIDAVSPAPKENVDLSGAIYHSGDDIAGVSGGDDEQISIELLKLPEEHTHLVFLGILQNKKRTLDHVLNTKCRVGDGKTDSDIWTFSIEDGGQNTACVMLSLSRDEGTNDWRIKNISEYRIDKNIEDWAEEVLPLL